MVERSALSLQSLTERPRSRKGIKSILHSIQESAANGREIVSIDDISADGVADLSVDEQLAVEANDGDGDDDAS